MQAIKVLGIRTVRFSYGLLCKELPKRIDRNVRFSVPSLLIRHKYSSAPSGVKGIKGRRFKTESVESEDADDAGEFNIDDNDYDQLANSAMHVTKNALNEQSVFIIQPYVKWGPKKLDISPDLRLQEAEALVRSLPRWSIIQSLKVPLESLDKRSLFGTGKLEEIRQQINKIRGSGTKVTCVFISKGTLSGSQKRNLEQCFGLPVMDRYSVVIQILRLHATSNEAKLQVAMAEIPYIWSQLKDGSGDHAVSMHSLSDTQKQLLRNREKKLKTELNNIRTHRELLRNKRKQKNFPIVAVVGYTNAGKTSLIKALTQEDSLQPRNQLFATLDVTAHAGLLPSQLKVIYMDTVGFMSDIPTGLIECFVATLEDAMLADVIIHVHDVSHENHNEQRRHVEQTLRSLLQSTTGVANTKLLSTIINVGNKSDLIAAEDYAKHPDLNMISSKKLTGIDDLLLRVEERILEATQRQQMIIRVPMGGSEASWLYKNCAVTETSADPKNPQNLQLNVVISEAKLHQFRHHFLKKQQ